MWILATPVISYAQAGPDLQPSAPVEEPVVEVRVAGNRAIDTSKVMKNIGTRVGRPYDQAQVEKDVRKLATKGWFVDVRPRKEPVAGGVVVTFDVVERPTLQYVKYVGNRKMKAGALAKQTELKKGDPLDPYIVKAGKEKIEDYYRQKGYNNVQTSILEGDRIGDKGAVYLIDEGRSQKIWSVKFEGNTFVSDGRLKTQIESKPPILWMFKGQVDRKKIDDDVDKLTAYYRSFGYFSARVGRELEFNEERDWLTLTFVIDEGPRYQVRNVSFIGNSQFPGDHLAGKTKLKPGEYFDQMKMNQDLASIRDTYGSVGYIFTDVQADPRLHETPGQLDLVYKVAEGDRYRVGKVNVHIAGDNPHTRQNTVLNRLSVRPGDIVDSRQLKDSERRLKASSLFLSDPSKGVSPKIVFAPPDGSESKTEIAREKGSRQYRGQSPDPPPTPAYR